MDTRLKSIVDRIENLEMDRAAIGSDIRDVYSEAKSLNYPVKALRKVIAERKQKDRELLEADMEMIRAALGSNSYRSVAKQLGMSKSKLHRLVPREKNGTEAVDPTTGEITTARLDTVPGGGDTTEGTETAVAPAGDTEVSPEVVDLLERTMALPVHEAAAVVAVVKALTTEGDGLDIPAFLRRSA